MSFNVGDIILFQSDVAGKAKFHFCFFYNAENGRYNFMFLNSGKPYQDDFIIDDHRLPNMNPSRSGKTIFCCLTTIIQTLEQIKRLQPKTICRMPPDVAAEFREFAMTITSMTANNKARLIATLESLM